MNDIPPSIPGSTITIADVAAASGVSIRTVSRVLNESSKVGKETRKTILATIERMGFSPNSRARGLAAGRSFLIGVVQDDPNAHVIGVFQRGIVEVASKRGYELVVHPASYGEGLVRDVEDFVRRSRVDGLILLPPTSELDAVPTALARLGIPAVGIAAVRVKGYPIVLIGDERRASAGMADRLVEMGHRRIAMITGPMRFASASERETGFREALARHGIALSADSVCEGDYSYDSGLAAARRLLSQAERPTAIFASNDIMAAATLSVAGELNLRVPHDVSVVGFDDSDIARMMVPRLTTIRRPLQQMAAMATERLLDLINARMGGSGGDEVFPLKLVERDSAGPPPA